MTKLNLAALNIALVASETRKPVTSTKVKRPVREIRKEMNRVLSDSFLMVILNNLLAQHGEKVDAANATWLVDHDDCARVLRTSYNAHCATPDAKMDSNGARNLWTQVYQQAHGEDSEVIFHEAASDAEAERD